MKFSILFALFFITFSGAFAQVERELQQFDVLFRQKEDKQDLSRLRDFLEERDQAYRKLVLELDSVSSYKFLAGDSALFAQYAKTLDDFLKRNADHDATFASSEISGEVKNICLMASAIGYDSSRQQVYFVKLALDNLNYWLTQIGTRIQIKKNIEIVNEDRAKAVRAIQHIYNIEKGDQDYKIWISGAYAFIILLLIIVSFLFLHKKSTGDIGNDFLNGNGLQFIALFAIIISTILFGVLGILEGKELAAILSGISGFILGKGLNVSLTKRDTNGANKDTGG